MLKNFDEVGFIKWFSENEAVSGDSRIGSILINKYFNEMTQNNLPPQLANDPNFLNEADLIPCPDCLDSDRPISNCCGARIDATTLICYDCKEHSDIDKCTTCDGTGFVEPGPKEWNGPDTIEETL